MPLSGADDPFRRSSFNSPRVFVFRNAGVGKTGRLAKVWSSPFSGLPPSDLAGELIRWQIPWRMKLKMRPSAFTLMTLSLLCAHFVQAQETKIEADRFHL